MSKSQSYPCKHPITAVCGVSHDPETERTMYSCKKCGKQFFVHDNPTSPLSQVVENLQEVQDVQV